MSNEKSESRERLIDDLRETAQVELERSKILAGEVNELSAELSRAGRRIAELHERLQDNALRFIGGELHKNLLSEVAALKADAIDCDFKHKAEMFKTATALRELRALQAQLAACREAGKKLCLAIADVRGDVGSRAREHDCIGWDCAICAPVFIEGALGDALTEYDAALSPSAPSEDLDKT